MKYLTGIITLAALAAAPAFAQSTTAPDLTRMAETSVWRLANRGATLSDDTGHKAVKLDAREGDGMAWLVGSDFSEGTIEVDLRGANQPGRSFVGLAFRGVDDTTFDAVYFRPFNFKQADPIRRARAVQYVSMPAHPWQRLREEHPGKYEATVNPVPDPDGWFHARIVLAGGKVSVWVNNATEPCLVVTELSNRRGGQLGLWVGNGSGGAFANLKIAPRKK